MSDRIYGGLGLLVAALFIWQATAIEPGFIVDPLGPSRFPIIIGGVLGLASLYSIVFPDPPPHWPPAARLLEIAMAVAVLAAYSWFLPELGFVLATAIAAAYLSWRLGTHPAMAAVAGVAISVGIYVVFHLILGLSLARGPWGF